MERKIVKELAAENKVVMLCHGIEAVIITLAYIAEIIKGARTPLYVACISVFALVPVIIEMIVYKKNDETKLLKHIAGIGYALLYAAIMFTTNNTFAFVYVIPMLIAITIYNDVKYSIMINVGVIIVNIIEVVILLNNGIFTKADSATIEIQMFSMLLVMIYSVYASSVVAKINKSKFEDLNAGKEEIENAQKRAMDASAHLVEEIEGINNRITTLTESLNLTKEAMEEVNAGSSDTASAVQKQLEQTEAIQNKVEQVTQEKEVILQSTEATQRAIKQGNEHILLLVEQVAKSVESGSGVTKELSELDSYMKQMNSIVDIISGITEQTSLLSLNASIEAARAGEAGKGFAVVAAEISQMANQTQDATVNITKLIDNVSEAILRVIKVSEDMIEMIKSQNETTNLTAESFQIISTNSNDVAENAEKLSEVVSELQRANKEIIDSISTISAISEEVAAHSSDTLETSEKNIEIITQTSQAAIELQEYSKQLIE